MSDFERSTLRWTRGAVILSLLAVFFVCLQWWEMHSGSIDTHQLASDSTKQAASMNEFANQMKSQANSTNVLAQQATIQAKAAKSAATSAVSAARTAQDFLHLSQMAYIVTGAPFLQTGTNHVLIPVLNVGHRSS